MIKIRKIQAHFNNLFWLSSTYLLAPYFYFLIFLAKKKSARLKILVVSPARIGDLICITPVFREIKKKFPDCHLTAVIASSSKDILKNNIRIDETILVTDCAKVTEKIRLIKKLRKEKYDIGIIVLPTDAFVNIISFWSLIPKRISFTQKDLGKTHRLLSVFNNYRLEHKRNDSLIKCFLNLLKFIGIEEFSEKREIFVKAEEERKAAGFLKAQNLSSNDLLVGISCTAGAKLKEWASDKFASLADKLVQEKNAKIIFIGSLDDKAVIEKTQRMMQNKSIDASGYFKLHELPALLKELKLFISVDTGTLYMADALGVSVVNIAGPVDVNELCPLNDRSKIIQKKIYCIPCSHMFYVPNFCKEGHLKCLKEITKEEVFDVASELINKFSL